MCEERLSGLGIMSIVNDRARQLNLTKIINNFAAGKKYATKISIEYAVVIC